MKPQINLLTDDDCMLLDSISFNDEVDFLRWKIESVFNLKFITQNQNLYYWYTNLKHEICKEIFDKICDIPNEETEKLIEIFRQYGYYEVQKICTSERPNMLYNFDESYHETAYIYFFGEDHRYDSNPFSELRDMFEELTNFIETSANGWKNNEDKIFEALQIIKPHIPDILLTMQSKKISNIDLDMLQSFKVDLSRKITKINFYQR